MPVIQPAFETAVHEQPAPAVTVTLAEPPAGGEHALVGLIEYEQGAAAVTAAWALARP